MSKLEFAVLVAKSASTFVVGSGAGTLIKTGVQMTLPIIAQGRFATYKRISVGLGAAALGGLTADATSKYLHRQIDEVLAIAGVGLDATADLVEGCVVEDSSKQAKKG